jgi:hypothetical protein
MKQLAVLDIGGWLTLPGFDTCGIHAQQRGKDAESAHELRETCASDGKGSACLTPKPSNWTDFLSGFSGDRRDEKRRAEHAAALIDVLTPDRAIARNHAGSDQCGTKRGEGTFEHTSRMCVDDEEPGVRRGVPDDHVS